MELRKSMPLEITEVANNPLPTGKDNNLDQALVANSEILLQGLKNEFAYLAHVKARGRGRGSSRRRGGGRRNRGDENDESLISRRSFMKLTGAGLYYATTIPFTHGFKFVNDKIRTEIIEEGDTSQSKIINPNNNIFAEVEDTIQNDPEKYATALTLTGINIITSNIIGKLLLKRGIPIGNLTYGEMGINQPDINPEVSKDLYCKIIDNDSELMSQIETVVIGPLLEELLYRYILPRLFISEDDTRMRWDIGIATSLLFGYHHNLAAPEKTNIELIKRVIPVRQITLGLVCHYLERTGGFSSAVLAHQSNNLYELIAIKIGNFMRNNNIE